MSVHSPLHELPHLLGSPLTVGEAFEILGKLARSDDVLERNLARLCQEMLRDVRREHEFFQALRNVYDAVVRAPSMMPPADVRKLCARGFQTAFRQVRCVLAGEEHLPSEPGQIDSHFVSAMVLDRKYGDGGIRVVRHSRGTEYGHQDYYDRLGHIAVYTHESDRLDETLEQRHHRRSQFYETAARHLRAGTNLILSPEGTSYWTEDSPGPFKPGAFRLAASLDPEPWIVPVAVAHFDRRVHSTVCAAVIKPPFRVSEVLSDPTDREQLRAFLIELRENYRRYVEEARRLADAAARAGS